MRVLLFIMVCSCFLMGMDTEELIEDFHFSGVDNKGSKLYDVQARTATILKDKVKMEIFQAKLYEDGPSLIRAKEAVLDKKKQDMLLRQDVEIFNQGRVLKTSELYWSPRKKLASTEKDVDIREKELSIKAQGLSQEGSSQKMEFKKNITMKFKREDSTFTYITCKGPMEIDYKNNIAVLHKEVKVSDPQGDIYADRMDLYFEPQTRKINKVYAKGHVKIVRPDSTTYAQEAEYDFSTSKLTLKGEPRILIVTEDRGKSSP